MWVLGLDRCRRGWAGICLSDDGRVRGQFQPTIAAAVQAAVDEFGVRHIAVDIPIGLPDTGVRRADVLVRRLLAGRSSTLFVTPTRTAVYAPDRATASALNVANGGPGVTAQAFAIAEAIKDVDQFLLSAPLRHDLTVVEAHPETCFAEMNGGSALADPKRTWAGLRQRLALLDEVGISIPDDLGAVGSVAAIDDIVDAAAVAWTARRLAAGQAVPRPAPPEIFSDGFPAAIWA